MHRKRTHHPGENPENEIWVLNVREHFAGNMSNMVLPTKHFP
jgi:hypothetical protein